MPKKHNPLTKTTQFIQSNYPAIWKGMERIDKIAAALFSNPELIKHLGKKSPASLLPETYIVAKVVEMAKHADALIEQPPTATFTKDEVVELLKTQRLRCAETASLSAKVLPGSTVNFYDEVLQKTKIVDIKKQVTSDSSPIRDQILARFKATESGGGGELTHREKILLHIAVDVLKSHPNP